MFRLAAMAAAAVAFSAAAQAATRSAPVDVFWNDINNDVVGGVPADRASISGATLGVKDSVTGKEGGFLSLGLGNVAIFDFGGLFSAEGLIVNGADEVGQSGAARSSQCADER